MDMNLHVIGASIVAPLFIMQVIIKSNNQLQIFPYSVF